MNTPQATILLKAADGSWTAVGTETSRGIVPEGITVSANEFGPDTCSFSLRREASLPWPDLLAFNQADVIIGGTLVWGGRIWEAPVSDGDEDVIAVQGRGWQYHLDDDLLKRFYAHTSLTAYVDSRSKASVSLVNYRAAPQAAVGDGAISLVYPNGFATVAGDAVGVTFDAGASLIKRVVITWDRAAWANDGNNTLFSRCNSVEDPLSIAAVDDSTVVLTAASGTLSLTCASPRRFHHLFLYRGAGTGTYGADVGVRITDVKLFGATAYESGGASVLKTSQVFTDVLASTALPLLDPSTSKIDTTAFSIPDFAPSGYQTPRALMSGANAYEGNLFGVDAERKVFLRERDTYPTVEVGAWPGSSFQDASTNSGEGLYNRVYVQGTGPDGAPVEGIAQGSPQNLVSRQGFLRSVVVSVESPLTSGGAGQIAGIWMLEREQSTLKGSLSLQGWGGARYINGGDVHSSEMLLRGGQLIRLSQLVDPATGDQGRDGIIKAVSYQHDTETASVELDSERGRLETLLSRLAVVTGQIR